jgi:PAS domain S-box-containing protein
MKNGPVKPEEFRDAFAAISISDLLITMKECESEPMLLIDSKGYIIVCNEAFETITGYYNDDVYMTLWHQCLPSQLTEQAAVDNINNLMKQHSEYTMEEVKSITITSKEGKSFICQMVLLFNVIKYKGVKLDKRCLTYNEITRIQNEFNRKRIRKWKLYRIWSKSMISKRF